VKGFTQALKDADRVSPDKSRADVAYDKGSIVVCYACGVPLYRLQRRIYYGQPAGSPSDLYAPVSEADVRALMQRHDLDPGIRAAMTVLMVDGGLSYLERIAWPLLNGHLTTCPKCDGSWAFYRTSADQDGAKQFADRVAVIQLATIPPFGKARPLTIAGTA
jgi:hypothetical protein